MDNKDTFKMTYSANEQDEIKSIREKYLPREESKLEQLRRLDETAGKKATAVSLAAGITGTLIMGVGMSIVMSDFGKLFAPYGTALGVLVGFIGISALAVAYPLYNSILKKERKKNAPEILRLTDELLK